MRKLSMCTALTALMLFAGVGLAQARTLVLDHFVVSKGTTSSQVKDAFQYQIAITNAGGLGDLGAGGPATVQLFLFNEDGTPVRGKNGDICSGATECTATVQPGTKHRFNLSQLVAAAGGLETRGLEGAGQREVVTGFAILTIEGAGAAETTATAFFVNIHNGAFNLSPVVLNLHEVFSE